MKLFTLDPGFVRDELIEGYISAIWTERFFSNGEAQIVVPATPAYRNLLKEGKFLALEGSKEVMLVQEHNTDKGLLTVKGNTLDLFLNERQAWFQNTEFEEASAATAEYKVTATAGQAIANAVTAMVINPQPFSWYHDADLDWDREKIPGLVLGDIDTLGLVRERTIPLGELYDGLKSLATANGLGFRIFLDSVDEVGYTLKFELWRGKDRTSNQDVNELVRLSPKLNSLINTKEILSIADYKNVVYVHYKKEIFTFYAEPTLPIPEGFQRRTFVRMADGDVSDAEKAAYLAQQAADAFANNNYVRAIDGETVLPSKYRYQRDYRLGDVIELEGLTGLMTKARVTEYIRSSDETGEKEYPTIAVVDPLDTGNLPTLDTNPGDFEPDMDPGVDEPFDPEPDPGGDYEKGKRPPTGHLDAPIPGHGGGGPGPGGGGGDGDPDPNDGGTEEHPGPWTPGQNAPGIDTGPGGNAEGLRLYFMRSFTWIASPAATEDDDYNGYHVGDLTLPNRDDLMVFTDVHVGSGGDYDREGDRMQANINWSGFGLNNGVVGYGFYVGNDGPQWPNGVWVPAGGYAHYGGLQYAGSNPEPVSIFSFPAGFEWAPRDPDEHWPHFLPDATGSIAFWVYGPIE